MAEEYYPTWQRQRLLMRGFNFHCRCERCCGFEAPELCCAFRCPECEVGLGGFGGWVLGGELDFELKIHGSHGSFNK